MQKEDEQQQQQQRAGANNKNNNKKKNKTTREVRGPPAAPSSSSSLSAGGKHKRGKKWRAKSEESEQQESVQRLLMLASSGDRAGSLKAIAEMQPQELDQPLPTTCRRSGEAEEEEGVTFLLRAAELQEVEVVAAILQRGGSCSVRTRATSAWPRGRDAWTQACANADLEILKLLLPHVSPASHPWALFELLHACAESGCTGNECTTFSSRYELFDEIIKSGDSGKEKSVGRKTKSANNFSSQLENNSGQTTAKKLERNGDIAKEKLHDPQSHKLTESSLCALVIGLIEREEEAAEGRGWADVTAASLATTNVPNEFCTLLHLCIYAGLPLNIIQALLLSGFKTELHELDNRGFTPLQLTEYIMSLISKRMWRQVKSKMSESSRSGLFDNYGNIQHSDGEEYSESSQCDSDSDESSGDSYGEETIYSHSSSSEDSSDDDNVSDSSSGDEEEDDDDDDDDDVGDDDELPDQRMRCESNVGDWAYLDEAFLYEHMHSEQGHSSSSDDPSSGASDEMEEALLFQDRNLLKYLTDVLLVLVDANGIAVAFNTKLGLSSTFARRIILQQRCVFSLLDSLCNAASQHCNGEGEGAAFELSSWQARQGCDHCRADIDGASHTKSASRRSAIAFNRAMAHGGVVKLPIYTDNEGPLGKFMDPGFHNDGEEVFLIPAINIILEAARLYSITYALPCDKHKTNPHGSEELYSGRYSCRFKGKNKEEPLSCVDSDPCWLRWFLKLQDACNFSADGHIYEAPTERSLRCVIWVLCCSHYKVRDRHVRTWAHILQDLTTRLHLQQLDISESTRIVTMRDLRLAGDVRLLETQILTPPEKSTCPPGMGEEECGDDKVNICISSYSFSSPLVMDMSSDPLRGLSHPAVVSSVLSKLGDVGFSLLFNITGQVITDDGEEVPYYEEEHYDALFELFLCVVAPRLAAYHKQLLTEDMYGMSRSRTGSVDTKHSRKKSKKRKVVKEEFKKKEDKSILRGSVENNASTVSLEDMSIHLNSIGTFHVSDILASGRLLLPHELSQCNESQRTGPKAQKFSPFIQMSMLRYVTEYLKPELLTLWHAVDNMLSLLTSNIDEADRLAALVRGMYIWMVVDEATVSIPPIESFSHVQVGSFQQAPRGISAYKKFDEGKQRKNDKKILNQVQWHPWSVIAAAASQHANILPFYRKYQLKSFRRHGDSSAVKYLVNYHARRVMQGMLVENWNLKHNLSRHECLHYRDRENSMSADVGIPVHFMNVCRLRGAGLSALLDSDSRDSRENLLSTHLGFLLRVPWVLEDQQRMDVALNTLHDGVQDRVRLRERDRVRERRNGESTDINELNPFHDIEIHLNRFTEPQVWVESVLQQLQLVVKDPLSVGNCHVLGNYACGSSDGGDWGLNNNLYRSELSVLYQGEAGMGPGPIKELLEMCRLTLLQVQPISSTSLQEGLGSYDNKDETLPLQFQQNTAKYTSTNHKKKHRKNGRGKQGNGDGQVPLHSLFPLFRAAGDNYPDCVVPLEVDIVVDRTLSQKPEQLNEKDKARTAAQLRRLVHSLFECVGVILGFAIRSSCPLGLGMPNYVWKVLLNQVWWATDACSSLASRRKNKESNCFAYEVQALRPNAHSQKIVEDMQAGVEWQELVGHDASLRRSFEQLLSMSDPELSAMQIDFEGTGVVWDPKQGQLAIKEVPLLRRGNRRSGKAAEDIEKDTPVTTSNRKQYVNLYCKRRFFPPSMQESIRSLRRGLVRVIPQELINIMSAQHVGNYVLGDVSMDLTDLRMTVEYEGYDAQHRVIRLFWRMLEHDFSERERRALLLFWTGSSVPPTGGFSVDAEYDEMLISKLTHNRGEDHGGQHSLPLPEASTCDKHLYLPEYNNIEEMRLAIRRALKYSSIGFDKP